MCDRSGPRNWPTTHNGECRYVFAETTGQGAHPPGCVIDTVEAIRGARIGKQLRRIGRNPDLDQFPAMRRASHFVDISAYGCARKWQAEEAPHEIPSSLLSLQQEALLLENENSACRRQISKSALFSSAPCVHSIGMGHPGKGYDSNKSIIGQALWSPPRIMEH